MPHLRKENRQLDVHSFFIFFYYSHSGVSLLLVILFCLFSLSLSLYPRIIIVLHCIISHSGFCPSSPLHPTATTSLELHLDFILDSL